MGFHPHYLPDIVILLLSVLAAVLLFRWNTRPALNVLLVVAVALVAVDTVFAPVRIARLFPPHLVAWGRGIGLFAAGSLIYAAMMAAAFRQAKLFRPERRQALRLLTAAAVATPVTVGSFAILRRDDLQMRTVDVPVRGLHRDLHGLRIAQLTDIHLSPFVQESTLVRAVGMANEMRPHVTLVTGDLISTKGDPLDVCIRRLSKLRADAGLWGCLGNHERYAEAEDYAAQQSARIGLRFLRRESARLHFGGASLNLVGIDYLRRAKEYDLGTEGLLDPDSYNVLLSHNPDVFRASRDAGFDLTVGGHTHGGQVTLEMLHPSLNIARYVTPWVHGLYEENGRQIYVSRGIGTIGVPARLGAPPEVTLLRLCAI